MKVNRRTVLKLGLAAAAGASPNRVAAGESQTPKEKPASSPDYVGVLVDTTLCIGCRKCEEACNRRNHLPRTAESFSDRDVLRSFRRPTDTAFTVVNRFPGSPSPDQAGLPQTYCKVQCMHCLYPSCVSACIVAALTKSPDGAVVYNPTICIGCRYCQVACPFEIPAYEFHEPLLPECASASSAPIGPKEPEPIPRAPPPAPPRRWSSAAGRTWSPWRRTASKRRPDRYVSHIYGETEVGGTSWLYLTGRPVQEVGLLNLPDDPAATTDRGHPARDLQVRHHPRRLLRPAGRDHVVQAPETSRRQSRTPEERQQRPRRPKTRGRWQMTPADPHRSAASHRKTLLHLRHPDALDPHGRRVRLRPHPHVPRAGRSDQPGQPQPLGHLDCLRRGLRRRSGSRRVHHGRPRRHLRPAKDTCPCSVPPSSRRFWATSGLPSR